MVNVLSCGGECIAKLKDKLQVFLLHSLCLQIDINSLLVIRNGSIKTDLLYLPSMLSGASEYDAINSCFNGGGFFFMEDNRPASIRINQNNLYREEIFSDLMVGSIHQMTPVKPNAELDKQRKVMFIGNTQLITPQGPLPVRFPIEAKNLQQAIDKFPESLEAFVKKMVEEAKELQRKEESRIIMPGSPSVGNLKLP
jgi:hypothetical protein